MQYLNLTEGFDPFGAETPIRFKHFEFPGGETHIKLESVLPNRLTWITGRLHTSNDIMLLLLSVDALRRSNVTICGTYTCVSDEDGKKYKAFDVFEKEGDGDVESLMIHKSGSIPVSICEEKGIVKCLWDIFGGTTSLTGYKVLDSHIGAIYGDSITVERAKQICQRLERKGFASTNIVLGIGSYTYQYVTRDTYGWAMKATYGEVKMPDNRVLNIEIFKDPITDDGTKKSARGLLCVSEEDGEYSMKDCQTWEQESIGELISMFKDGVLIHETSLSEIRKRMI